MVTQNIKELVDQALRLCDEQGFAKSSIHGKHKIFKVIIRKHEEFGLTDFNGDLLADYVMEQEKKYEEGRLKRDPYLFKVKTALQLRELVDTGFIDYGLINRKLGLNDYYSNIIDKMLSFSEWDEKYAYNIRRYVIHFFKWLASHQIDNIEDVDEDLIRKYMLERAKELRLNSIGHMNYGLKRLFYFLRTEGLIMEDYSYVFSLPLPKEHRIHKPIPHEEIAATLKSIDRTTPKGMRDYAMILIGTVTGLRSIDIQELKFDNIDWINGEIRISQAKTGKALALPLTSDVGDALKQYILHGRPESDSKYIFLRTYAPYPKLTRSALYNVFNKYRFTLGLPRCGFHDLRRALGTNLVTTGTPVTTVAQVLGHRNLESTKQYIALDAEHLRDVGLNLDGFMPKEEGDDNGVQ
ncbi:MAG: tyrosine-type recombinase/integrase [Blautia sp.]|nr:tyrosine-type recombinase/integrase [Blautia sp.]